MKNNEKKAYLLGRHGGKCVICDTQYNGKNGMLFHFHHVNGKRDKVRNVSDLIRSASLHIAEQEADKCIVLCMACHTKLHMELGKNPTSMETSQYIIKAWSDLYD